MLKLRKILMDFKIHKVLLNISTLMAVALLAIVLFINLKTVQGDI